MGGRVACRSRLYPVSSSSYYRLRSRRNVGSQVQPHGASNKVLGNVGTVLGCRRVVLVRRAQHVFRSRTGRRLTIRSSRTCFATPTTRQVTLRTEERRGGKEWVRPGKSGWWSEQK